MKQLIDIPPVWLAIALIVAWLQKTYLSLGLTFGGQWADFVGGLLVGGGLVLIALAGAAGGALSAEGTEAEKRFAFADAFRMLNTRIEIFVNLPLQGLDKLALQKRLDEIAGTAKTPENA